MNIDKFRDSNEKIEKAEDRLSQNGLENHKMWDSQLLTLSTVILGVSVSFLDKLISYESAHCTSLVKAFWLLAALTIIFTVVNFLIADVSYSKWRKVLSALKSHNKKLDKFIFKANSQLDYLEKIGNMEQFKSYREDVLAQAQKYYDEYEDVESKLRRKHAPWNNCVWILNVSKTVTFVVSIALLMLYINVNL
jgi:ABC-type multidrug transport system fused ATPase/permease subunit